MAISSSAALASIEELVTQTRALPCRQQNYDLNKLAFSNKVAAIVIHILSNEALCREYLTQLSAAVFKAAEINETDLSTAITAKEYKKVRNVMLPQPDQSVMTNLISARLLQALQKVLLLNQQQYGINAGLNQLTAARLMGQIPNDSADQMILNRQLWTEVSIKPESIYHGAFSHAIQLYIMLNALHDNKIDLSIFTTQEREKLAEEQYFLHPYLVYAHTNYKFAKDVPSAGYFYRNSHWNIALDNDTANKHSMLPIFLTAENKLLFNFCSPNYIQNFLFKKESFNNYAALSRAVFFEYSKSIISCYGEKSAEILFAVDHVLKTNDHAKYCDITNLLIKFTTEEYERNTGEHKIYREGTGIFYNYTPVTAARGSINNSNAVSKSFGPQ